VSEPDTVIFECDEIEALDSSCYCASFASLLVTVINVYARICFEDPYLAPPSSVDVVYVSNCLDGFL
jgi:hypothetical protein